MKQLVLSAGALLSGTFLARVLSAVTLIFTARLVGPDVYGQMTASLALVRISSMVYSLGLDAWLLRMGGRHRERLGEFLTIAVSVKISLGFIWIGLLWIIAPLLKQDAFPFSFVILLGIAVWGEEIIGTIAYGFEAILHNRSAAVILTGLQVFVLLPTGYLVMQRETQPEPYLIIRFVATAAATILFLFWALHTFRWQFRWQSLWQTLRETPPYAASLALGTLARQADVTIVANFLGKTAAGLYSPAITVVSTLFLVPQAVYSVMLPILSRTHEHQPALVKTLTRQLMMGMLILGLLFTAAAFVVARPIITLTFGPEYELTGDILRIFSLILFFRCLSFAQGAFLTAVGWQSRRVMVQVIVVVINIVLNLLVVFRWGLLGVAWVYVLTEAGLVFGCWLWIRYWHKLYAGEFDVGRTIVVEQASNS